MAMRAGPDLWSTLRFQNEDAMVNRAPVLQLESRSSGGLMAVVGRILALDLGSLCAYTPRRDVALARLPSDGAPNG